MLEQLTTFFRQQTNSPVTLLQARPLAGGASMETWALELQVESGRYAGVHHLVLRADQSSNMNPEALSRAQEFDLLHHLFHAGVKVAQPRFCDRDGHTIGRRFLVVQHIQGESIGPRVVRRPELANARQQLAPQLAQQLALIHAIDPAPLPFLPRPNPNLSPAQHACHTLRQQLNQIGIPCPTIEFGLRWLSQHQPPTTPLVLIHGDFRIGNLIINPSGLQAVIDWEFAHIGDYHEDLSWICVRDWRFGNDHLPVGGIAEREPFIEAYQQSSGRQVNRQTLHYWEILGNLRWAAICRIQAHRHLSGADPSVEYASLGRRAAEMELESLDLISEYHHV